MEFQNKSNILFWNMYIKYQQNVSHFVSASINQSRPLCLSMFDILYTNI